MPTPVGQGSLGTWGQGLRNQGQNLFCSLTTVVGFPSSDLPQSPLLVQWAGKVSTEPLAGPWVCGDMRTFCLHSQLGRLSLDRCHFVHVYIKINTLFFIFTLGWSGQLDRRPSQVGSTKGNFCTKPSSKCLECLSGLLACLA